MKNAIKLRVAKCYRTCCHTRVHYEKKIRHPPTCAGSELNSLGSSLGLGYLSSDAKPYTSLQIIGKPYRSLLCFLVNNLYILIQVFTRFAQIRAYLLLPCPPARKTTCQLLDTSGSSLGLGYLSLRISAQSLKADPSAAFFCISDIGHFGSHTWSR